MSRLPKRVSGDSLTAVLKWSHGGEVVTFACESDGAWQPLDRWALLTPCTASGAPAHIGVLYRLRDEGRAVVDETGERVVVRGEDVACMTHGELAGVGLPPPVPYSLDIQKRGLISDPDFVLRCAFVTASRKPVLGARREGPILRLGS